MNLASRFLAIIVATVYAIVCNSLRRADEINARAFHERAMDLVLAGDYSLALANFRAACRHNDHSSLYWNDLGVTEMRMGELHKARKRFLKAIAIDPNSDVAKENLAELNLYLPPVALSVASSTTVHGYKHTVVAPTVLTNTNFIELVETLRIPKHAHTHEQSATLAAHLSKPFIVPDAFQMLGISEERVEHVFNRAFLTKTYGQRRVDFYPHNMIEEQSHPYFLSLGPALQQLLSKPEEAYVGVDASEPGTYIQWNLDQEAWEELFVTHLGATLPGALNDTWWLDQCFRTLENQNSGNLASANLMATREVSEGAPLTIDGDVTPAAPATARHSAKKSTAQTSATASQFLLATHWQMLLIGEQNAGMFNHQDTLRTASWQLQIVGSKKWHLCGPEQSPFLYGAGKVDLFRPNFEQFPLVRNASCMEVTLQAGQLLYYPADYWHQTVNLETPSIALSSTLVTQDNHRHVAEELRRECRGAGRIFVPEEGMCAALDTCFALWEAQYAAA